MRLIQAIFSFLSEYQKVKYQYRAVLLNLKAELEIRIEDKKLETRIIYARTISRIKRRTEENTPVPEKTKDI